MKSDFNRDVTAPRALAAGARRACAGLAQLSAGQKNRALRRMAGALRSSARRLLAANALDVAEARAQKGLSAALISRLELTPAKIGAMADSIDHIAGLADPVGRTLWRRRRPNGMLIRKVSVPIGVILIIYESRPNVTADCMALCLKSGNSVILRGGSQSRRSNAAICSVLSAAAAKAGVPKTAFTLVTQPGHGAVSELLKMNDLIDLVIPRGGEGLIRRVVALSKIPVIKHYKGICHVYVDKTCDLRQALSVAVNAKVQNPAVCNAMETLLVHRDVARSFLPALCDRLRACGVELRGCPATRRIVGGLKAATESDWTSEYLDLILSIRVVGSLDEAIRHIETYGSHHSDSILTSSRSSAERFCKAVDSACVFVNASTRLSDGGQFGMGAEMGISTDKLHARGPMGLEELTSYKYVVLGHGQIRR